MKTLIAAIAGTLAVATAPQALASPYTDSEIDFLNDVTALGIINSGGSSKLVEGGWLICWALYQGSPRSLVAQQVYESSQSTNGAAGLPYTAAQALVFYASADLCPGVGA